MLQHCVSRWNVYILQDFKNYIRGHNTVKSKVYDDDYDGGGRGVVDGDEDDKWR